MKLHHVGCLIRNIEAGIEQYKSLHHSVSISQIYEIKSQEVRVCFVHISDENETCIELVQPTNEASFLYKLMTKKGMNFYHLGFFVSNINRKKGELEAKGYRIVNSFESEAFGGRKCVFLYSPDLHLIELIEAE